MNHCGKQVFFKNGRFWIQHENGVDCVLLDLSSLRGRDGAGSRGPAGAPGSNTVNAEDEGIALGAFSTFNFVGAGVTATNAGGGQVDVTIPGGGGGNMQLFANALFVDSQFGNDATAIPFSLMDSTNNPLANKYQTIAAALAAAQPGDVVIVYPGDYVENTNLYANGVTYYFYPDANVTSNNATGIFTALAAEEFCNVFGKGNFTNTNGPVVGFTNGVQSTLYLEAFDLIAQTNPINMTDGFIEARVHDITSNANAAINMSNSASLDNNLLVYARNIRSNSAASGNPVLNFIGNGNGASGQYKIVAERIFTSPNSANKILLVTADNAVDVGTRLKVVAEEFVPLFLAGVEPLVDVLTATNIKVEMHGNMTVLAPSTRGGLRFFAIANIIDFLYKGNITVDVAPVLDLTIATTKVTLDGVFTSNNPDAIP